MIKIKNKEDCCGCTACVSICNNKAITIKPDALGFLYPKIDVDKCINCGLCEKVCSFNSYYDKSLNLNKPEVFGARHKDINELMTSRSGAAFIAISDYIIEHGGIVYGVGYDDFFNVVHKRAKTKIERNEFKGSKYVQSNLTDIFLQVRKDLKEGKKVLFSGTPCQTSGLKSFIGKKLGENLLLIDVICHGVPSPYIWKDYIKYIEELYGEKIISVNFRDKECFGWSAHVETFILANGKKIIPDHSPYTTLFYKHLMLRPSCGNCHFCNTIRPSDITIGDFWGWEKSNKTINEDDMGVSLLLINTNKGKIVFSEAKKDLNVFNVDLKDCLQYNLLHRSKLNSKSRKFEKLYKKYGFSYVYKKYSKTSLTSIIISYIRRYVKRIVLLIYKG